MSQRDAGSKPLRSQLYRTVVVVYCITCLASWPQYGLGLKNPDIGILGGRKIYVLDVGDIAVDIGIPDCVVEDNVVVDQRSRSLLLKGFKSEGYKTASHKQSAASGPWYLYRALQKSKGLVTDDIWKADIVYIYDYCYYSWWLAHVHTTGGNTKESPGSSLIKGMMFKGRDLQAWMKITQTERWKLNGGRDYLFFHPHPHFVQGIAASMYNGMMCYEIYRSMHVVLDSAQFHECPNALEIRNLLVVPSVPHAVHKRNPLRLQTTPVSSYKDRKVLVFFQGRCSQNGQDHLGWKLRRAVVDAFRGRESEIVAECLHGDFAFKPHDRSDIPSADNAVFCIIMRGGVESSRALNDAFLGGCIPVFVGPPFHTLPFASQIAYEDFAVFFELQDLAWVPKVWDWEGDLVRGRHLDASAREHYIRKIHHPSQILDHLYGFLEKDIIWRGQELLKYRHLFTYDSTSDRHENAVTAILQYWLAPQNTSELNGPENIGQNLSTLIQKNEFGSSTAQSGHGSVRESMNPVWRHVTDLQTQAVRVQPLLK